MHEARKVLSCYQRDIARFVHVQMQAHYWEKATGYEVKVSKGFSELKPSAYTASASEPVLDYRQPPADKSNMAKYLFGGFQRCLYPVQKFRRTGAEIVGDFRSRIVQVVQAPERPVPDILQIRR